MKTQKIYNSFTDKHGNEYKFETYMEFAKCWFAMSRKVAKAYFPENFEKLQRAAANSKEARAKA